MDTYKRSIIGAVALLCLTAICKPGRLCAAQPNLTEADVTQIAASFCEKMGQTVSGPAKCEFPLHRTPLLGEPERYWKPRWEVSFPGQADVEVVDETGAVVDYGNPALIQQLANQPAGKAIPEAEAVRLASEALQATGHPLDELTLQRTSLDMGCSPPSASCHDWYVEWARTFHGIEYPNQGAMVIIQAETGAVEGLGITFPSPPATKADFRLTREEGAARALKHLKDHGITDALLDSAEPEFVIPNTPTLLQPSTRVEGGAPHLIPPRLVWNTRSYSGGSPVDVWVDAQTGEVVGGEWHFLAGRMPRPKSYVTAEEILQQAGSVKVLRRKPDLKWEKTAAGSLDDRSSSGTLKALQGSLPAPDAAALAVAPYRLVVTMKDPDHRIRFIYYLPEQKLIGAPGDWVHAPEEFMKWVAGLKK